MAGTPRFIKVRRSDRPTGDRRSGERRSGESRFDPSLVPESPPQQAQVVHLERRQEERRSTPEAGRRRFERRPVPFGPASPSGALIIPDGQSIHVKLWDVSEGGLCVVSGDLMDHPPGTGLELELHAGIGVETLRVPVELKWVGIEDDFGTFMGLQLPEECRLPNGSFLDRFLTSKLPT